MRGKISPIRLYQAMNFGSSFAMSLIFTVNMVYQATIARLTPLQLVLVGTILEATVFLFEIPTGVLADVKSRRLSVVLGYAVMGMGFVLESAIPAFWAIALAQVVWGLGYTFTSGASEAWVVDEAGEAAASGAFLRGAQASQLGGLTAIPLSIAIGSSLVRLPIIVGGILLILISAVLALTMTEHGFRPTPAGDRTTVSHMAQTMHEAVRVVRRAPILATLLGIGFFYGLYSEGLDRLWTPHLLNSFTIPGLDALGPVVWLGLIQGAGSLASVAATLAARRWVDTVSRPAVGRFLTIGTAAIILGLAGLGVTRDHWVATLLFLGVGAVRAVHYPLHQTWVNDGISDPQVRATLLSASSQVDAIGQIAGGPAVGAMANRSLRAALVVSAAMLAPAVPLYAAAMSRVRAALARQEPERDEE
jgi:DHA3 family tetracycline resistance protein-like MFS transporter